MLRTVPLVLALALVARSPGTSRVPVAPRVEIAAVPGGGIQPQAAVDAAGTIHLLYFKGDPAGGDLFYVRRAAGEATFSQAIRVTGEPGSAIATGSVRGGQLALGRNGWIHVAWNGSRPIERGGEQQTPMWYSRLRPGATAFEPQRAIGRHTRHLDGGGSVAADQSGRVFVAWHAAGAEDGEPHRRIYVASSVDDGAQFGEERAFSDDSGACGCCGLETIVDGPGWLHLLYRAAGASIHRDAMWLTVRPDGAASPVRLQPWELAACPMTTFALAHAPGGLVAAWETQQQIFTARLDPVRQTVSAVTAMPGTGLRKHPAIAINGAGDQLIAWTEGTAWARGGSAAWQLFNPQGGRLASGSSPGAVPVWSLVAAVARKDGSFLVLH
jgi:hypothetical protein